MQKKTSLKSNIWCAAVVLYSSLQTQYYFLFVMLKHALRCFPRRFAHKNRRHFVAKPPVFWWKWKELATFEGLMVDSSCLTVRVCVDGVDKLSVRGVQPVKGVSSFKHGPGRVQAWMTRTRMEISGRSFSRIIFLQCSVYCGL